MNSPTNNHKSHDNKDYINQDDAFKQAGNYEDNQDITNEDKGEIILTCAEANNNTSFDAINENSKIYNNPNSKNRSIKANLLNDHYNHHQGEDVEFLRYQFKKDLNDLICSLSKIASNENFNTTKTDPISSDANNDEQKPKVVRRKHRSRIYHWFLYPFSTFILSYSIILTIAFVYYIIKNEKV